MLYLPRPPPLVSSATASFPNWLSAPCLTEVILAIGFDKREEYAQNNLDFISPFDKTLSQRLQAKQQY